MSQSFIVEGATPGSLNGSIRPQGAKNEALQVISAVILTSKEVIIRNVPDILDVQKHILILKDLGVSVTPLEGGSAFRFKADNLSLDHLTEDFYRNVSSIRGSLMILSGLISRLGVAMLPIPGGDKIGRRRLDAHIEGLGELGVVFSYKDGVYKATTPKGLRPAQILLPEASVTGTANVLMLASGIEGKTSIYNAACEPYVQQLCHMLIKMGVRIDGVGSNLLCVHGTQNLKSVDHMIMPDMIEVGSWIGLAAMSRSAITIKDTYLSDLGMIPKTFSKIGVQVMQKGKDLYIPEQEDGYNIPMNIDGSMVSISDAPWPGFTPDLISIILVVAIQARGEVLIHQKMFESRLYFANKLMDMGGKIIQCDPHRVVVIGLGHKIPLKATVMYTPDIRAGVSLLIAALCAKGTSEIQNIDQIDRGYERIDERLRSLGANIVRVA